MVAQAMTPTPNKARVLGVRDRYVLESLVSLSHAYMSAILSRTSTETLRLALSGFIWVLKNDSIAKLR